MEHKSVKSALQVKKKLLLEFRQGCNGSSNLFLLVTYLIIEKMYDCFDGIKSTICKIEELFFADDEIILMQSLKDTLDSIKILSEIADGCGLSINKSKVIFNSDEQPKEINGIPVTTCLNYLGVKVHNNNNNRVYTPLSERCFQSRVFISLCHMNHIIQLLLL